MARRRGPGLLMTAVVVGGTTSMVMGSQQKKVAQQQQIATQQQMADMQANQEALAQQQAMLAQQQAAGPAPNSLDDQLVQIQKLSVMKDQGLLTEEEFNAKKAQILGI
jgi:hemolysin activation/secretion protein